jgi:hypothetical protein
VKRALDPELGRRLRLEWACQGDPEQVAGVKRLIAEGERISMRRGRELARRL